MGIAAVARRPAGDVVEIRQHLRVRHLADQLFEQGRDIVVLIRIALTEVQFRRDSQIAFLCRAATKIANMFMHAENFLYHDNDRQRTVGIFGRAW